VVSDGGTAPSRVLRRGAVAFGRFWWEFLVGDTPELLVGGILAVSVAALLVHGVSGGAVAVGALPALVVGLLGLSAWRARSRGGG
jgi:hypothetical protein